MNHYGRLALEHNRRHRPRSYSQISDPTGFFHEAGEAIQADVSRVRDEILRNPMPHESPEGFRLRSYQALATAEELVLADHHLFQPESDEGTDQMGSDDDPDLERQHRLLSEINRAIHTAP